MRKITRPFCTRFLPAFKNNFVLFFILSPAIAFSQNYSAEINKNVQDVMGKVVEWRRHFHENPELSNREFKTGKFIAGYLTTLGMQVKYPVAKTGVVGILKGSKPGPVIALRADIDGLPVTEQQNVPFYSKVVDTFNNQTVGVMHACGHDSHISMLMGAATVLSKMKADIQGTIIFLFQPAEEGAPNDEEGGAPLVIKEGALDNPTPEAIFGIHIMNYIPAGEIAFKQGAFMASADWFTITVNGKGSHGSQPWKGVDPIAVSAQIINGLQTIISRQEDLTIAPAVITVGAINGGIRSNIMPDQCTMIGTIRTLDSKMQQDIYARIKRTAENIATSAGATATVEIKNKTMVTYNDSALVTKTLPALQAAVGAEKVKQVNWMTGAEDFSFYQTKAPSFFFFIGGLPKGGDPTKVSPHHTAGFFIDESGFDAGVKAFCQVALNYKATKK